MGSKKATQPSRLLLQNVLDKLDQGCILFDGQCNRRYINAKASEMLKNTGCVQPQDGPSILIHCDNDPKEGFQTLLEKVRTDAPYTWTKAFRQGSRSEYRYSLELFNGGPEFSGFLLKMTDISVYAGVEQQLHKSNERYLLATRASYDMIWERDFPSDRYYFSEALHSIYGYDPDTGWGWNDVMNKLIHPDDRQKVIDFVTDCYRHKIQLFQCPAHRYMRKDGAIIWVDVRCFALYDATGKNTRTIGVTRDISREQYLKHALHEEKAQLQTSNQQLERFVYITSHDLQEPLRTISNLLSVLKNKYSPVLDEKARQYINLSVTSAQRMQAMVKGLLDLAKVGTRAKKVPVDMEDLVQETLKDLEALTKEKEAQIILRTPLPVIFTDKSQIHQVILNLVGNAIKYTGNRTPYVEISCEEKEMSWHFSIKDNGIGIEEKYKEKIFEVFQRLHTQTEYAGSGIGLAIVKMIVESAGGSIGVSSEPGKGSCFTFTVPKHIENP